MKQFKKRMTIATLILSVAFCVGLKAQSNNLLAIYTGDDKPRFIYQKNSLSSKLSEMSFLVSDTCKPKYCTHFSNQDFLQLYGVGELILNKLGGNLAADSCLVPSCSPFANTDLKQIYNVWKRIQNIITSATPSTTLTGDITGVGTGTINTTSTNSITINGTTQAIHGNPSFTVSSGITYTNTAPITITSGSVIGIAQSNSVTAGYLTSADWNTFNNKGSGTVTSVSALTLGTTGTDLSSTVANGTTTPVITLNVPDASASARGVITTGIQTIAGAKTFSTAPILSSLSASQILSLDGSKNIQSLDVTTYPSLTELSYVKGLTSAIQTQLNSKSNIIPIFSGKQRSMPYTGVVSNAAITGTIYYYPYYVGSTHTVTAISSEVTTLFLATTINMALYSDDGTGKPGSLIEASGTISSATTGVKTYIFSTQKILLASNQVYWLAIQLTTGPSLKGTSNPVAFMYNTTGQSYQQTQAYGSFPSSASSLTAGTLTYLLTLTPQ